MLKRPLETFGLTALLIVAVIYVVFLIVMSVMAFPVGLIGMLAIGGALMLLLQAIADRVGNEEDNYYSKNVDK